jgi:GGDEF domain-containing protein
MARINIPGVGLVDFPDSMSEAEIADAIDNDILKTSAPKEESKGLISSIADTALDFGKKIVTKPFNDAAQIVGALDNRSVTDDAVRSMDGATAEYTGFDQSSGGRVLKEMTAKPQNTLKKGSKIVDGLAGVAEVGLRKGYAGIGRIEAGALDLAGDMLDSDKLRQAAKNQLEYADEVENAAVLRGTKSTAFEPDSIAQEVPKVATDAIGSVITSAPALVGGAVTGGAALPAIFATSALSEYGAAGDDLTGVAKTMRAIGMGAAEALGEKLGGTDKFADALTQVIGGKNALAELGVKLLTSGAKEIPSEEVTTTAQFLLEKNELFGLNQDATLDDYIEQVKNTAKVAALQGSGMSGAGGLINAVAKAGAKPNLTISQSTVADDATAAKLQQQYEQQNAQQEADAALAGIGEAATVDDAIALATETIKTPLTPKSEAIDASELLEDANVSATNDATGLATIASGLVNNQPIGSAGDSVLQPIINADTGLDSNAEALTQGSGFGDVVREDNTANGALKTDLANLQNMGKGVTDSLYGGLFKSLQEGKDTFAGIKDSVLIKSKSAFDAGVIKSPEDLRKYVNAGYPEVKLPENTIETPEQVAGEKLDKEWTAFTPESGSLGIPRAEMPQIKAENRGAMTNFLNARGISHEQVEVPSNELKPTQLEFSQRKIEKAKLFKGGDRSILISADNHVLDGHHQWMAKLSKGEPIDAIRLNAPIAELIDVVKEFPSATVGDGANVAPITSENVNTQQFATVLDPVSPENNLRPLVESLVKRRAAAAQSGMAKSFDNVVAAAKDLMEGKPVSPAKLKTQANLFKNKDKEISDILMQLHDQAIKTPDAIASKENRSATAKKLANERMKLNLETDGLMTAIAKLGGLNSAKAQSDFGIDPADMKQHGSGIARSFKSTGMDMDAMRELLLEQGYPVGETVADFGDALADAMNGIDVLTAEGQEALARKKFEEYSRIQSELSDNEQQLLDELIAAATAKFGADIVAQIDASVASGMDGQPMVEIERALIKKLQGELNGQNDTGNSQATESDTGKDTESGGSQDDERSTQQESPTVKERRAQGENRVERRGDEVTRKNVADMSADEMRAALLVDDLTGIGNRRAYDESVKQAYQVSIDADGLKWINDNLGHESGDVLLAAIGEALGRVTTDSYHISGDEFVVQAGTEIAAADIMETVNELLAQAVVEGVNSNGDKVNLKGIGISYGIAKDLKDAETKLQQHKQERETTGQRSGRGEQPANATITSQRSENNQDNATSQTDLLGQDTTAQQAIADAERAKDAKRNSGKDNQDTFTLTGSNSEADQAAAAGAQDLFAPKSERAIWIPNMTRGKLDRLLNKESLTDNDIEALKDFKYFLINDKQSATDKGFYQELLTSGQTDKAYVLKDKFLLTKIDSKLEESKQDQPADSNQKEASFQPIADFGEKLEGAKKDLWRNYQKAMSDELPTDVKEITLSKHFPEPDYDNLIASGIDVRVIAAVKAMRDEITSKPKLPSKVRRWASEFTALREFSNGLINGSKSLDDVLALLKNNNVSTKFADRIKLYGELGYPAMKSAKGYTLSGGWTPFKDGVAQPGKQTAVESPNGRREYYPDYEAALDALRAKLAIEPETTVKKVKLDVYRVTRTGELVIGKKVASNKYIDLKVGFKTSREAFEYYRENEAQLLELLEQRKNFRPERKSVNNPRVGTDYRMGEDVTPEKFAAEFGFRGVQFGNYVEQSRRPRDLNNAYDALLDLSHAIGIPPRAISLNGTLGLAFGARGSGGKNPAAAHYEPSKVVINLTKVNGFGSLGHEWFHAMDNYLSKARGKDGGFVTGDPKVFKVRKGDEIVDDDSIRPELVSAFGDLMTAIRGSDYYTRSVKRDSTRTNDYWGTNHELAARAFEAYLITKATADGKSNDYLANVEDEEVAAIMDEAAKEFGGNEEPYPYPTKAEQVAINPMFDKLFATLQTKETDTGTALFSRSNTPTFYSALSRAIDGIQTKKADPAMWKGMIRNLAQKGVKPDEIEWTGINEWLDLQKGVVTKEQVQDYLNGNGVQVSETLMGLSEPTQYELPDGWYTDQLEDGTWVVRDDIDDTRGNGDTENDAIEASGTFANQSARRQNDTKYSQYTVPGGENYKELLLTLPINTNAYDSAVLELKEFQNQMLEKYGASWKSEINADEDLKLDDILDRRNKAGVRDSGYSSSHFDQRNILAHVRFDERTDADGNKVLFINEIQSDWAQEGKKKGFSNSFDTSKLKDSFGVLISSREKSLKEYEQKLPEFYKTAKDVLNKVFEKNLNKVEEMLTIETESNKFLEYHKKSDGSYTDIGQAVFDYTDTKFKIKVQKKAIAQGIEYAQQNKQAIPNAPFVGKTDAWVSLALKRMMRYAADNGFDKVAIISGEQAADLYDLRKSIGYLNLNRKPNGFRIEGYRSAESLDAIIEKDFKSLEQLEDIVGKEVAKKLIDKLGDRDVAELRGDQLAVGGEGMRTFYDSIVPKVAKDVLKKLGGIVEKVDLTGEESTSKYIIDAEDIGADENFEQEVVIRDSRTNEGVVAPFNSIAAAEAWLDKNDVDAGAGKQTGFTITPAMRDQIMQGLPLFSKAGASGGMAKADVSKVVNDLRANWKNAPQIIVVDDMSDPAIREAVRAENDRQLSQGAEGQPEGFFDAGKVYVVASEMSSAADVQRVVFHETLGHYGLRGTFGKELNKVLESIVIMRRKEIDAKAKQYGLDVSKSGDRMIAAEEVLAEMAQTNPQLGFVQRAIAAIRTWLRNNGFKLELTDNDIIANYLLPARAFVKGQGKDQSSESMALAFQRSNQTDAFENVINKIKSLGININANEKNGDIALSKIEVPKNERESGKGTSAMKMLAEYADSTNQYIKLTPTSDFGGNKLRLVEFYKRFGFVENKSGNKIFTISESMYRKPKSNTEIRFSRQGTLQPQWDNIEDSKLDTVIQALQDKNIDLKRVTQNIKKAVGDIDDRWNAYLQEELYHGRTAKRTQDFVKDELEPLINDMRMRGVEMADFEQYLHARHAEERNVQIAKINPDMPDGGSGMTTQEANDYLDSLDAEKKTVYKALAKRIDSINNATRQLMVSYGLESTDTIEAMEAAYEFYVPLQREEMDMGGGGTGQGFSIKGSSTKRALGSNKNVVDIIANIAMQREKIIVRGEKNRVSTALIGLAKLNPNEGFWSVDTPPTIKTINKATGLVDEYTDPNYKSRNNVVVARIVNKLGKVEERSVVFNEFDERAMRMAESIKNLDVDTIKRWLEWFSVATRYFASINTQYNPIFGIINITRDVQGALLNLTSTELAGKQKEVIANTLPALKGIYQDVRSVRKGNGSTNSEWSKLWEDFQEQGGQTGFRDMFKSAADRGKAIEKALDPDWWTKTLAGKVVTIDGVATVPASVLNEQAIKPIFNWLSDYNQTLENAVRLSVYKVALDNGISKQQAASIAKNISVNFNRKGSYGRSLGALYAFFNASTQGTARIAETLTGPAGKQIIAGGLFVGVMQAIALSLSGYDDEEPPEFVRDRNLIIPLDALGADGRYVTIPMPLGFNVLPNFGRITTEWLIAGGEDTSKRLTHIFSMMAEMFNPIGGNGSISSIYTPTAFDPFNDLDNNKDWTGRDIAREDFNSLDPTPGFTRTRDKALNLSVELARYINNLSGGSDYTPGVYSPTGDQIEYLAGQLSGGVGRELMKTWATGEALFTGEDLPTYKVPLVGRFVGNSNGQAPQGGKFYNNLIKLNKLENEIIGRDKDGKDVDAFIADNPEIEFITYGKKAYKGILDLRKQKREMVEAEASREEIKAIDDEITNIMTEFNQTIATAKENRASE